MMTFNEIYETKKALGLPNAMIENLASDNAGIRAIAMKQIEALNFKSKSEVELYIAMNI